MWHPNDVIIHCYGNAKRGQKWAILNHLRLITSKLHSESFCFQCIFVQLARKNIFPTLKILYVRFRATLNLCKNDVSLKLVYKFFSNLAHLFIMFVRQKYVKFKNFYRPALKLLASKVEKGVCLVPFDIAMITNFDVKA